MRVRLQSGTIYARCKRFGVLVELVGQFMCCYRNDRRSTRRIVRAGVPGEILSPKAVFVSIRQRWYTDARKNAKRAVGASSLLSSTCVNSRRWSPASEVQILLLQVEEPGPNGNLQVTWRGDIPLAWRHQQLFPLARTMGRDADADLCSVRQGGPLKLHLLIEPLNLEVVRNQASTLVLSLQARGSQADSPVLRIRVAWDGGWHDGTTEMRGHLTVEPLQGVAT